MTIDSGTPQGTGTTVADAADRIASLLGPADSETDETLEEQSSDATDEDDDAVEAEATEKEGEPEAQDEADEPDQQPELYTVKVAGEEVQVTLDEALKGYSREQDYVRKTMALADQRKAAEAEIAQRRDEYSAKLDVVGRFIEATQPRVDQSLRESNPAEWSAQMHQLRQWQEQKAAVEAERSRIDGEKAEEEARERQAFVTQEAERLRAALPEWSDPAVAEAEQKKLVEYAKSNALGSPLLQGEIDNIADHRVVVALRKAMLFDELMAKKDGVRAAVEAKKVAKPGVAAPPVSRSKDLARAKDRLRQSGRVDDAAAAIERLLG